MHPLWTGRFSLGISIIRVLDQHISQMTRVTRRDHDMGQPVPIRLQVREDHFNFMSVIPSPDLQKSSHFFQCQPHSLPGV
jgi:hypothetical protein